MVQFRAYLKTLFDLRYVVGVQAYEEGDEPLYRLDDFVLTSPEVYAFLLKGLRDDLKDGGGVVLDFLKLKYVVPPGVDYVASKGEVEVRPVVEMVKDTTTEVYMCEQFKVSLLSRLMESTLLLKCMLTFRHTYKYFKCLMALEAKGYKINADNPEESYLEIISEGNEQMIDLLADYLDAQEFLENVDELMREYGVIEDRIKMASTVDEVRRVYAELTSQMGTPS